MTDYHIHIGQFNEKYYDDLQIFETIEKLSKKTRITTVYFSSTSSCREDVKLSGIEEEINYAQCFNSKKNNYKTISVVCSKICRAKYKCRKCNQSI